MFKSYLPNLLAQGSGRFMTLSAHFTVSVLIARFMGPDTFGKYTYILAFVSISIVFVEFATTGVMAKQLAQLNRSEAQLYWGNFLFLRGVLLMALFFPIVAASFLPRPDLSKILFWCTLSLPFFATRFFEPLFQIFGRPWLSTLLNAFYSFVWVAAALIVISFSNALEFVIAAYIISNILYTVLAFYFVSSLLRPVLRVRVEYIKTILRLALPLGVSSIFSMLTFRISIFMLSSMQSDFAVGLYSVPYRFLEIAVLLTVMFLNPLIPIFSKYAQNNFSLLKSIFTRIFEIICIIMIPVAILTPLFSRLIIKFIFGAAFIETADVLNIIAWIAVLVFLNFLCSTLTLSLGIVRHGFWNTAFALTLTTALNYVWIKEYGYLGCAWSAAINEIFLFIIVMYYVLKNIGNFFYLRRWLYILGGNMVFFLWLKYIPITSGIYVRLASGLIIYLILISLTHMINIFGLTSILARLKPNK